MSKFSFSNFKKILAGFLNLLADVLVLPSFFLETLASIILGDKNNNEENND